MNTEGYLIARKSKNWRFKKIVNEDTFMNVKCVHPSLKTGTYKKYCR